MNNADHAEGELIMDVRFSTDPLSFGAMSSAQLRKSFLIDTLFVPDDIPMVYSDIDRSITGSAVPVTKALELKASKKEMAADYFAERREIGVINIGQPGSIVVDGGEIRMAHRDALYIGRGVKEVIFKSGDAAHPARFYFVSYPAHASFPTTHVRLGETEKTPLGTQIDANRRTIYKYIHPRGVRSCQLVMGLTELEEGNVWNTMPPHTHQRRSEVYMYFNVAPDAAVFHLMGTPEDTRHIVMRNEQAVLNPSWSIHAGGGTRSYTFIWAMGGENQVFEDMDGVKVTNLA
jgi:4-deoxy-L-threo-5-hexosulose-uronate ketol-isomerase